MPAAVRSRGPPTHTATTFRPRRSSGMLIPMRLPFVLATCLASSLSPPATAQASQAAQSVFGATLAALSPITASWRNAPAGTPGATVSHPIGPLQHANVSAPIGAHWAAFQCDQIGRAHV